MKVSPLGRAQGGQTSVNLDEGKSAGAGRIARAKAAFAGQDPGQAEAAIPAGPTHAAPRTIQMKTNATPMSAADIEVEEQVTQEVHTSDASEQTKAASEDTKPLSPEAAALLKHKRALDVREKAVEARETELKKAGDQGQDLESFKAKLKADPLVVLLEEVGPQVYDQLTQAVLKDMEGNSPTVRMLESQVRDLHKKLEDQNKGVDEKTQTERTRALGQMQREADKVVQADDAFELVRANGASKQAIALIERVFDETGEILDVREALGEIENDLLEQALKVSGTKKVQSKLSDAQNQAPQEQRPQQMRTLTNRDSVSPVVDRRARAIAAFHGKKLA